MAFLGNLFGFGKVGAVGVDIGSSNIKVMYVQEIKKGPQVLRVGLADTPKGTVKDGKIVDPEALGEAIRQVFESREIPAKKVVSAVSGQSVVVRPIRLPQMPEKDLNEAIKFEAERYLPYSASDAQIACQVITKSIEGDEKHMEVLLVSAQKEMVQNIVETIEWAGYEPEAIDLEPFAMLRALQVSVKKEQFNQTIALIDLGASSSSINIVKNGILRHNRTITVAGNNFTKAIGQALNLTFDEAEKLKKEKGIIRVDKEEAPIAPAAMRIFNVITPVLTELVTEIQRSFDYYRSRYRGEMVDLIITSGGTSSFKNIDKYLEAELGTKVQQANPLINMHFQKDIGFSEDRLTSLAPELMVSVGLAMRQIMLANPAKYQSVSFDV
jgi:type IV pilus assembly protein PilM